MDVVDFAQLTDEQRAQVEGEEHDPFDAEGATLRYRAKDRHVGLVDSGGRLVASAGIVMTQVGVEGTRFRVVGLGGVIVNAEYRGRGLARQIVEEALARARTMGPSFAILFCLPDRAGFYRQLGFAEIAAPVSVRQPRGFQAMPDHTMWRALRPGASWPAGDVVVCDLPF